MNVIKRSIPWLGGKTEEFFEYTCQLCGQVKSAAEEGRVKLMAEKHEAEHKKIEEDAKT